jgi:hypothetical protein
MRQFAIEDGLREHFKTAKLSPVTGHGIKPQNLPQVRQHFAFTQGAR